jgi:hypothetical protein
MGSAHSPSALNAGNLRLDRQSEFLQHSFWAWQVAVFSCFCPFRGAEAYFPEPHPYPLPASREGNKPQGLTEYEMNGQTLLY